MNRTYVLLLCLLLSLGQSIALSSDFQLAIGLSYIEGLDDIATVYEDNLRAEGYIVHTVDSMPIALALQPYVQFENSLGIGVDIGPAMIIYGDSEFFCLPIALMGKYIFLPESDFSPYVKAGISHQIASGDYVESSSVGAKAAVGLELLKTKKTSLAVEFAYDTSEIEFLDKKVGSTATRSIKPAETTISLLFMFK